MTRPLRLPTVTATRLEFNPEQEISIHDFLRGLKRPGSKAITAPTARGKLPLSAMATVNNSPSEEHTEKIPSPRPSGSYAGDQRLVDEFMKAPKVLRTYTRKAKSVAPLVKSADLPPHSRCQGDLQNDGILIGGLPDEAEPRWLNGSVEQRPDGTSYSDSAGIRKNKKRRIEAKRKSKKAPINGLAPSLITHSTISPGAKVNFITSKRILC